MKKILIVEDELIVAMDIERMLVAFGHEVCEKVSLGERALEVVEAKRPDLILMDINLKGKLDGVETARRIKSRFDIPIIFMTASVEDKVKGWKDELKVSDYIKKPIDENELKTKVEKALGQVSRGTC